MTFGLSRAVQHQQSEHPRFPQGLAPSYLVVHVASVVRRPYVMVRKFTSTNSRYLQLPRPAMSCEGSDGRERASA